MGLSLPEKATTKTGHWRAPDLGHTGVLRPGRLFPLRLIGWLLLLTVVFGILTAIPAEIGDVWRGGPGETAAVTLLSLLAVAAYFLTVRWFEKRAPTEIGLAGAATDLAFGIVIGAASIGLSIAILIALGAYEYEAAPRAPAWDLLSMAVASGVGEELLVRAIILRLLMRALGGGWAIALSALLFGLMHYGNDHAGLASSVFIALEAGVQLGALYILTGRIWASVGAHAAWNFTTAYAFGAPVSGWDLDPGYFEFDPVADVPVLLSGGAFGPEASIVAAVVDTAIGVGVLWWAWKLGRFARSKAETVPLVPPP